MNKIDLNKQNLNNGESQISGKTILLINTGSIKKRFTIQRLKKLGHRIIVLNKEKNWAQPYVDFWILADNTNHAEAIQAVKEFISSNSNIKIDGVLTFWEDDVLLTSKIIDKFNFIGIPFSIAKKIRNKFLFRNFCSQNGIAAPQFWLVRNKDDLDKVHQFKFPLVLKPVFGSSSAFVVKVDKQADLAAMYQYIKDNISASVEPALTDGLEIFIEEFIDGDEVDIDLLLQNGKIKFFSIADNFNKNKGVFFVDSGQSIPSSLPLQSQEELLEVAEATLEKLGVQNGCIHFEAKYTKNGVYPIEINLRLGGDYVYSYTKSTWGVDLIENAVKIATGDYIKITKIPTPKRYIIGWDLHPEDSGVLVELENPDYIKKNNFVDEVQIYKTIGDPIFVPPEGFEHLGWVTVFGENLLDAQDNLEETLKSISYKVVKFDPASFLGKTARKDRFSPAVLNKNLLIRAAKIRAIKGTDLTNLRKLHIGLLSNLNNQTNDLIESQQIATVKEIEKILLARGYIVSRLDIDDLAKVIDELKKEDIDLVFNLASGLNNNPDFKSQLSSLLDLLQIPYTGSDPFTLSLAADKIKFKKFLSYQEIPTPEWDYLYNLDDEIEEGLKFPLIVKPANTDYSVGISNDSVVTNQKELDIQLKKVIQEMNKPVLIEEYVEGDEYEIYILGNDEGNLQVLPLRRSIFDNLPKDFWHLYTYEAKWLNKSPYNQIICQLPPKNISKKLESLITEIALDTYTIFGCKDYGKVEAKVDKRGNPYVIELNPSPWLYNSPENGGIVTSSSLVGIDYGRLIEEIIRLAVERYKKKSN